MIATACSEKPTLPSPFWYTSNVMLKSSITSPGGFISMCGRTSVRYRLAKPGTMGVALTRSQVWPNFSARWPMA